MKRPHTFWVIVSMLTIALVIGACSDMTQQPTQSTTVDEPLDNESGSIENDCSVDLPEQLPTGKSIESVKALLETKRPIPLQLLVPDALEMLSTSYSPDEYYIDKLGLHWGHPDNRQKDQAALGNCYHPYGFSIVGGLHFAYWFHYRPPSYDAYMAWFSIYAQPYGANGILVQKRDMCLICGCNPFCTLIWTRICAK